MIHDHKMNSKKLDMKAVIGFMDASYTLVDVDYRDCRDNLDENLDAIQACLEQKSREPLYEQLSCRYDTSKMEEVNYIVKTLKNKCVGLDFKRWEVENFFEEEQQEIEQEIYNRDDSNPIRELLRYSGAIPVRVELISNYDCINSHWLESSGGYYYEESYFGDMVDALHLNPSKVKQIMASHGETMRGSFPNKRSREGNEQVSYEDFYQEMINSCCGANLLTYTATVNVRTLYDANFNFTEIVIPKGNVCGLYSSTQGGGSMIEMKLKNDVAVSLEQGKYPSYRLKLEYESSKYDYSIKHTYGVCDSFFGNTMRINTTNQSPSGKYVPAFQ